MSVAPSGLGTDPSTSVVDPYGRVHDAPNVVVADSSVFVTASGYGPTLTLVALGFLGTFPIFYDMFTAH